MLVRTFVHSTIIICLTKPVHTNQETSPIRAHTNLLVSVPLPVECKSDLLRLRALQGRKGDVVQQEHNETLRHE